jgi:hypothetical protein
MGVPGTAANQSVRDICASDRDALSPTARGICAFGPGAAIAGRPLVAVVVGIFHPLPNVAVHVVKSKCIRRERGDRRGLGLVPSCAAIAAVRITPADLIAPPVSGCRSARAAYSHSASVSRR